jgi:hypothetical protein
MKDRICDVIIVMGIIGITIFMSRFMFMLPVPPGM